MSKMVTVKSVEALPNGGGHRVSLVVETDLFTVAVSTDSPTQVDGIPVDPVEYARGRFYRVIADLALEIGNPGSLRLNPEA